jgi:acetyl esterase/lipase
MSKQQLAGILSHAAQNPPPPNPTPAMMRDYVEAATAQLPVSAGVRIERVTSGPCDGDLITPTNGRTGRLIIFYHGGCFFFGSGRTHRVVASNLARASGSTVLIPDYRLAPRHRAPAAHDDAFAVYRWALDQGYEPSKLALSGDSAGGNLALATAVRARDAGLPLPAALALMSPWLDLAGDGVSQREVTDDPILSPELLETSRRLYLGDGDRKSPTATPFYADFTGLPPTLAQVGSWERLRDDSVTLIARMKAAGVAANLKIFDGMCHIWQLYAPMLEEGMQSIEEAAAFIKAHQA